MIDEERIKNARQILTNIVPNEQYVFSVEQGKLVFKKEMLFTTHIFIGIIGIFMTISMFAEKFILLLPALIAFGFIVYTEFIINNFYVIDYNNGTFYLDKRRNGSSISKKMICNFKDIAAVGVNVRYEHAMRGTDPRDNVDRYTKESAVALLKKDGTLIYFNEFIVIRLSHMNNCYLSDAISELFNIPKLNCKDFKELKVVKQGLEYKLTEVPLVKPSETAYFAKVLGITFVASIFLFIITFILLEYTK